MAPSNRNSGSDESLSILYDAPAEADPKPGGAKGASKAYGAVPDAVPAPPPAQRGLAAAHFTFAILLLGAIPVLIVARVALDVAAPLMEKDLQLHLDHVAVATVLGAGTGAYGLGKVFAGVTVDKMGARRVFLTCIALITVACILFGGAWTMPAFLGSWALLKFAQSFIWPTGAKLVCLWYPAGRWSTQLGLMAGAFTLGGSSANIVMGQMVEHGYTWRALFKGTALLGAVALVLNTVFLRSSPPQSHMAAQSTHHDPALAHPFDSLTAREVLGRAVRSPRFWAMNLTIAFLTIICEFQSFLTLFLTEEMGLTAGDAAQKASIWQISIAVSNFGFGMLFDQLSSRRRVAVVFALMATMSAALLALLHAKDLGQLTVLVLIAVAGACMAPVYWQMPALFGFLWGGSNHCATIGSVIDACGYACAMLFDNAAGKLVTLFGWPCFMFVLFAAGVLATLCSSAYMYMTYLSSHQYR